MKPIFNALFTTLLMLCSLSVGAAPTLVVTAQGIAVSGVTPGGAVILFGVTLDGSRGVLQQRSIREVVVDSDNDGAVTYTPGFTIPDRAAIAAVDYSTGAAAFSGRDGRAIRMRPAGNSAKKDQHGAVQEIEDDWSSVEMLIVQPGQGVWTQSAADGGVGDDDRLPNGKLKLRFDPLRSLHGRSQGPKILVPGDLAIAIDPDHMTVLFLEVGK